MIILTSAEIWHQWLSTLVAQGGVEWGGAGGNVNLTGQVNDFAKWCKFHIPSINFNGGARSCAGVIIGVTPEWFSIGQVEVEFNPCFCRETNKIVTDLLLNCRGRK